MEIGNNLHAERGGEELLLTQSRELGQPGTSYPLGILQGFQYSSQAPTSTFSMPSSYRASSDP